jgi:hypothetical protein
VSGGYARSDRHGGHLRKRVAVLTADASAEGGVYTGVKSKDA